MNNMYPKPMNLPPSVPSAVSPAMHYQPYPQVNVFDIEQKNIDNFYMMPAQTKAVQACHPARPRYYSDLGIILVLYILLVIILRAPFFGLK